MKKLLLMIVICALCVSLTVMTGCGSKQETEEGDSGQMETAEETEAETEEEEYHEPNPYVDGMTLEEAESERNREKYGTMFIKSGDLFYPMVPVKDLCHSGVESKALSEEDSDHSVYIMKAEGEDLIHTLGADEQIVELDEENMYGAFESLSGQEGYTIDKTIKYKYTDEGEESLEVENERGEDAACEKIEEEVPDTRMLRAFAEEAFDEEKIEDSEEYRNVLKKLEYSDYNKSFLKMANWEFGMGWTNPIECILDLNKGQSVTIQSREEGDADIEVEECTADYKYFNLPDQFSEKDPARYPFEYTNTEYGYSILNTDSLPSGYCVCDQAKLFDGHTIFRIP